MSSLLGWAKDYIMHRDLIHKKIKEIINQNNSFKIIYKDGSIAMLYACAELKRCHAVGENAIFVVYNTKDNVEYLIESFYNFAKNKDLTLIFYNPHSNQQKKWLIKPWVHARIIEAEHLRQGIMSLFKSVDEFS
jgi:hypothetical protein